MARECEGYGRSMLGNQLVPCPYDAFPDARFCVWHQKIVDGLISDLGPRPRPRREQDRKGDRPLLPLSWNPKAQPKTAEHDPFEALLQEWG